MSERSHAELFAGSALTTFRLNGQFLSVAEELARPAGLTAAWWQVLGAIIDQPLTVAGIARDMGITRQSVQRIADLMADKGFAEYLPNPAHRRAKLLRLTDHGRAALHRITPDHSAFADRLAAELGTDGLRDALDALTKLSTALDALGSTVTDVSQHK
ncbi:MarR family winged helix-turn-helix transcriptional regulator [Antrihabitans spumae]|uniref:MarR family winged helix-turn-helix transcriptional regulator n=1 Tax=Antrihabitans spumae TaxID=3373370 RepID=A0ABW7KQA2_9NOCA